MYIEKYWGDYVGGTDDSLTLLEYLTDKQKNEVTVAEIISETGLDKLSSYRNTDNPLTIPIDEFEAEIHYAINLISDLAALLLECKVNGTVNVSELLDDTTDCAISITATEQENEWMNKVLKDFSTKPLSYDLCDMADEEDMLEMSQVCEKIRKELYE